MARRSRRLSDAAGASASAHRRERDRCGFSLARRTSVKVRIFPPLCPSITRPSEPSAVPRSSADRRNHKGDGDASLQTVKRDSLLPDHERQDVAAIAADTQRPQAVRAARGSLSDQVGSLPGSLAGAGRAGAVVGSLRASRRRPVRASEPAVANVDAALASLGESQAQRTALPDHKARRVPRWPTGRSGEADRLADVGPEVPQRHGIARAQRDVIDDGELRLRDQQLGLASALAAVKRTFSRGALARTCNWARSFCT